MADSKHIPSINNDELGALVIHDPARTEEPYSRRSQIASAVLIPNHGHWIGFYDPDDIDRQPLYVRANINGTAERDGVTVSMWDKCQVSINKRNWHGVGSRHGLGKFMMQWYKEEE
jgi:hypothetical protein